MKYLTESIIILIILFIITYGIIKKVKIYECFIEGAKEGLEVCIRIFPYLLAMLAAVGIFRESGALNAFMELFKPIVKFIGLPPEAVPLALIKPLSGSGAVGIYTEIVQRYGADSFIGRVSSIMMGSTETIFYTISVYYGAVQIKKIRHTLIAAIFADLTALIMSVVFANMFF